MKTYKNLYPSIYSFDNLYHAFRKARRGGKRKKESVAAFEYGLEANLLTLERELRDHTYRPGRYHSFYVKENKRRKISAAPFRDRVVHHALCQVIEPIFEARFISDSYACRVGKGTHRAIARAQQFARRRSYMLQCDIRQFFPSIDHQILRRLLARRIADEDTLWLTDLILDSGRGVLASEYEMEWFPGDGLLAACRPRGLPIGNLTSQFWANVYLHELDSFVKHQLRCRFYLRYVDDFLLFSDEKQQLHSWRREIIHFLGNLRLRLHEDRAVVFPTKDGVDFLGFRIYPYYRRLRRSNVKAFMRRLRVLRDGYLKGELSLEKVQASLQGWIAHAEYAHSYNLRRCIFGEVIFSAGDAGG